MTKNILPCGKKRSFSKDAHSDWLNRLNLYLKSKSLRATQTREKVAEIAIKQASHFQIQELVQAVQADSPEISPATVYRSVITLCDAGILHETLQSRSKVTLYEVVRHDHHDHIVCLDCSEIFEFSNEEMEKKQSETLKKMGFSASHHQHVIYAHCTELAKHSTKKQKK